MTTASRPTIPYPATTAGLIGHAVAGWGEAEMVVTETERITYFQADQASRRLAKRLLEAGAGKGTRVATQFP